MSDRTSIELDAQEAYEAIRSINHATIFTGDGIPAPVVYRVLGFLQSAGGYGVGQTPGPVGRGVGRVDSVAHAVNALTVAADLLQRVGPPLDSAQAAISRQGYRSQDHDVG